ncbi:MAG: methionine--tRNA ligase [Thermoplasmata archaeon]|jgi:methionyl-tRNA synthetase|nr:methionine--tRNA ligase [Thermoplasmatales archaeon]
MKILVCVAWPYSDGPLHLGHIYGAYLPADIFARYHRMVGNRVIMVSGSDEHGTPITFAAEREGVSPAEISERYHRINVQIFEKLGISFDNYSRTSSINHKEVVKEFFLKLYNKGYIYEGEMVSPYCPTCGRFLPDRYVEGTCPYCGYEHARGDQCDNCGRTLDPQELINPRCRICGSTPEFRKTKHLFFSLSKFEEPLKKWISEKDYWKENVKKFSYNFISSGLKDRAITRDIEWGVEVPVPGYEGKRIYVWFEAVIGYLSATIEYSKKIGKEDLWKEFWLDENTRHYYFIGKDNIPFHTIIWPAMLMAHGDLVLPYDVPANEYLKLEGGKFSKSSGHGIFMPQILDRFDPDIVRFYSALNLPELHDSDFSWEDFYSKVNTELIDKFGNFVNRVLRFTKTKYGRIPPLYDLDDDDFQALNKIRETGENMARLIENVELKKALREWLSLVYFGNQYFDRSAPWDVCKVDDRKCSTKLHISLMILKALAIYGAPYIPFTSQRIWRMLGNSDDITNYRWIDAISPLEQFHLPEPEILFKKLNYIKFENMQKLDMRVARILEVKDHPNADRLYLLNVSIGDERRTLVAGLKSYYKPEELEGRYVIILYNLEPAEIRGQVSQGMLLAADDGERVSLLEPTEKVEGKRVRIGDFQPEGVKIIKHKEFAKIKFEVARVESVGEKITLKGSRDYVLDEKLDDEMRGKEVILLFEGDSPFILRTDNGVIITDKEIKPGAGIR